MPAAPHVNGSKDSRTMTSHGFALLSLLNVHSQANLNNIYFDHININTYDYLENELPGFAVGTNSTNNRISWIWMRKKIGLQITVFQCVPIPSK